MSNANVNPLPFTVVRGPDRRQFLLGAAGLLAVGGLGACSSSKNTSGAGSSAGTGATQGGGGGGGNRKSVAFAQPDTSSGVYPLLVHGARQEAK